MVNRASKAVRNRAKKTGLRTWYIANARNGEIGTYATRAGAKKFLKKNRGGSIKLYSRRV